MVEKETEDDEIVCRNIESRVIVSLHPIAIVEYNINNGSQKKILMPPQLCDGVPTPIIQGSADGLLFMKARMPGQQIEYVPAVFNPSTGECRIVRFLPPPAREHNVTWFGKLANDEYAFVLVDWNPYGRISCYKFTPGSNDLNLICYTPITSFQQNFSPHQNVGIGVLVQGVVYWPIKIHVEDGTYLYKILAYRLQNNEEVLISPPAGARGNLSVGLFADGCSLFGCICPGSSSLVELWILKGGGPWTKYTNIDIDVDGLINPLGFLPDGDFLVDVDRKELVRYSFNCNKGTIVVRYGRRFGKGRSRRVIMCADTSVSP